MKGFMGPKTNQDDIVRVPLSLKKNYYPTFKRHFMGSICPSQTTKQSLLGVSLVISSGPTLTIGLGLG